MVEGSSPSSVTRVRPRRAPPRGLRSIIIREDESAFTSDAASPRPESAPVVGNAGADMLSSRTRHGIRIERGAGSKAGQGRAGRFDVMHARPCVAVRHVEAGCAVHNNSPAGPLTGRRDVLGRPVAWTRSTSLGTWRPLSGGTTRAVTAEFLRAMPGIPITTVSPHERHYFCSSPPHRFHQRESTPLHPLRCCRAGCASIRHARANPLRDEVDHVAISFGFRSVPEWPSTGPNWFHLLRFLSRLGALNR